MGQRRLRRQIYDDDEFVHRKENVGASMIPPGVEGNFRRLSFSVALQGETVGDDDPPCMAGDANPKMTVYTLQAPRVHGDERVSSLFYFQVTRR